MFSPACAWISAYLKASAMEINALKQQFIYQKFGFHRFSALWFVGSLRCFKLTLSLDYTFDIMSMTTTIAIAIS